ncbi:transmembrane protein 17A-like [Condylostylus longicornis]|uniref:transmembrane protein 17A-like n=1 Tax=Condylostylus longicornis TaxID=2530218 RepID=UPI00244E43FC|nr:transmembrane protein 17A-like [Condylostylus longicornis]
MNKNNSKRNIDNLNESQYKASLLLQMLLYCNVYISGTWVMWYGYYLFYNAEDFAKVQKLLTISGFIISVPAEGLRLYLGYSGNLSGKVSDLAGFWIISGLIQLPIHLYLSFTTEGPIILRVATYIILMFLICETPVGFIVSRKLSIYQAQLYHMKLLHSKTNANKNQ